MAEKHRTYWGEFRNINTGSSDRKPYSWLFLAFLSPFSIITAESSACGAQRRVKRTRLETTSKAVRAKCILELQNGIGVYILAVCLLYILFTYCLLWLLMMEWPWHRLAHSQAKLEKETREELATLEAKNRSLSHQLVLLQQEDEAQAGYIRLHRATAAPCCTCS